MNNAANNATTTVTHYATLNGERIEFNEADYEVSVGALVARHGGGIPQVARLSNVIAIAPAPKSAPQVIATGGYDAAGDARAQKDREAAKRAGFSPAQPVYRQGSRAEGMRGHRETFEALPLATDAAASLVAEVKAEERADCTVRQMDVRLNKDGLLAMPPSMGGARMPFGNARAFGSLVSRMGLPAGAGTYLPAIDPELRAMNVNHYAMDVLGPQERLRYDATMARKEQFEHETVVLRTRNQKNAGSREVYGVVSEGYSEFDADKLGRAIQLAVPQGARASVAYDGTRTKFDVVFFSNIIPEQAVAGEFFKAGVQIRTDDTGGGSLIVNAMIWQNLCLNFIIIDEAGQNTARIRHVGDPEKLAARFREAFTAALGKIEHFTEAWGYAQQEEVLPRSLLVSRETGVITDSEMREHALLPVSQALPGIFNGLLERDLVPLPKRDRQATINNLMTMWERDLSAATRDRGNLNRAAVVNAVTRYAHEVNADPFLEPAIEAAGGALLYSTGALPYVPVRAA